eukprot:446396-Prorocentrum_minimum.AAC.2
MGCLSSKPKPPENPGFSEQPWSGERVVLVSLSDKAEATLKRLENPRASNFTRTGGGGGGGGRGVRGAPVPGAPVRGAPAHGAPVRGAPGQSAPVRRPSAETDSSGQPLIGAPVRARQLGDTSVSSSERIQLRASEQAWREQREAAGLANPGTAW